MNRELGPDPDVAALITQLFSRRQRRATTDDGFDQSFWNELGELGMSELTTQSDGGTWADAAFLLRTAARSAISIPYAEHDLLARWLADELGLPCTGTSTISMLKLSSGNKEEPRATGIVPWADVAETLVVGWTGGGGGRIATLNAGDPAAQIESISQGPGHVDVLRRGRIRLDPLMVESVPLPVELRELWRLRATLARAAQITGAMSEAVAVAIRYSREREQFGKPIGSQQAVQRLVVDAAAESALATLAVDTAVQAAVAASDDVAAIRLPVTTAASISWHASSIVIRNAHEVLGAMGTTREHPLHLFTDPILAWRAELGSPDDWDTELATMLLTTGDSVWSQMVPVKRETPV